MNIKDLLAQTAIKKASDLHLSPTLAPKIRLNGEIHTLDSNIFSAEDLAQMFDEIMNDKQKEFFKTNLEIDFSYTLENISRFRVNIYSTNLGPAAAFRAIPNQVITLDELNAPNIFKNLVLSPRGLILVTGPTGSGKSTTLAAMINHLNENTKQHILTIEDPIEYIHTSKNSIINQRELNQNTLSFANALRSGLREDPDIIMVGEMRDLDTIRLALTAAETGHLVLSTLHTTGASKAVDRIIDVFPGQEQSMIRTMLSEILVSVISQTLIKTSDGKGRVAANEIMIATPAIKNLIRENKVAQMNSAIQTGSALGMQSLDQALKILLSKKIINLECAKEKANSPTSLV